MQILQLDFDLALRPHQIRAFRAAIAELVGYQNEAFHNHKGTTEKHYHWSYPLIQYSIGQGKVQMIGIEAGARAIKTHLLPRLGTRLRIMGQDYPLKGIRIQESQETMQQVAKAQDYHLSHWLALNSRNFRTWKNSNKTEGLQLLSRALTGQLRALAEAIELPNHKAICAEVYQLKGQQTIAWKETSLLLFNIQMKCNIALAPQIHIGRLSAYGFGQLEPLAISPAPLLMAPNAAPQWNPQEV